MATMKICMKCRDKKETTQFSKCSRNKDSLQHNCKECNKEDNLKFRIEINPSHHAEWQHMNLDKLSEYVAKYRKADKGGTIYSIRNPDGDTYIGMTETHLAVRLLEHRQHYKKAKRGKQPPLPLLHKSFDTYGIKNHTFETVIHIDVDRETLGYIESSFIQAFKEIGKSLNIRD